MNRTAIRFIIQALLLAATALLVIACSEKKKVVAEGLHAPKLNIKVTNTGGAQELSHLSGKVVMINFWASWCPPCKEEMPSIEGLKRDMLSNDNFAMITILYKDDPAVALDYMKANGYTFPVYLDNEGQSAKNYGVTGVPETYLIDKKGMLRKRVIGPADWNSADAKAYINSLLAE